MTKLNKKIKDSGRSINDLAAYCKVSRETITNIRKQRNNPGLIVGVLIARFFDTTVEELFSDILPKKD